MDEHPEEPDLESAIAVVGMHCLFPGANSATQFWERLCEGYEAVEDFSDDTLAEKGVPEELLKHPQYVKAGIPFAGVANFDYSFFGVSPKEAAVMDPQHRKFLECSWAALENSGHKPTDVAGAIGMYAGSGMQWYLIRNVLTHTGLVEDMGEFLVRHTANDKDFLATRASFSMNIHGPSINVQTACSTSLVAVHLAMQSLLNNECDMAIAGGSTIDVPNGVGYMYREEEVRSADGRCRAFDKSADGTVFGSGSGAVVLRRLEDAIEDNDTIHAVLLGSAINNDGSEKAGYMAPSVDYQARAIAEAMAVAGVEPDSVGYFEAHGTGTKIGDPIEVAALVQAFGDTAKKQFCGLGSVKTNIGHLDTAAGVASLIKIVQCLKHKTLPASLHYEEANPEIDFEGSPFFVNSSKRDWSTSTSPRIAGVSSLGVGGTNAHIIACEAPTPLPSSPPIGKHILPLSAKTATSLQRSVDNLHAYLASSVDTNIADIAYTLQEGRVEFEHRTAIVCDNAANALECINESKLTAGRTSAHAPDLVFMFSGQGAQYPGMAAGIYEEYSEFRDVVDECLAIIQRAQGPELNGVLFSERDDQTAATVLEDTAVTQPALFVVEYALARLLTSLGLQPSSMIGHSLGEYVAATLAGVFTLEQALRLVILRGQLIGSLPTGSMIAVPSSADSLKQYLKTDVEIAAINAEELTVLSGPHDSISNVLDELNDGGAGGRLLKTSHAFHSAMLEPVLQDFTSAVERLELNPPTTPFISNVSGTWITDEQAQSAAYWSQHIRKPVNFLGGIRTIIEKGDCVFLEVGPGNTLANLASLTLSETPQNHAFSSLPHAKDKADDVSVLSSARAELWTHGVKTDWSAGRPPGRRQRLPLPTYAFDEHHCWLDPIAPTVAVQSSPERLALNNWGYVANWRQTLPPDVNNDFVFEQVLVFANDDSLGNALIGKVRKFAANVTVIHPGNALDRLNDDAFRLDPGNADHYAEVLKSLPDCAEISIIHAWSADNAEKDVESALQTGFLSLMNLAKGVQDAGISGNVRVFVVASDLFSVTGEVVQPINATLLGPVRVIPSEMPEIRIQLLDCHSTDVTLDVDRVAERILNEFRANSSDTEIVYRGAARYCQEFDSVTLPEVQANRNPLKQNGVYLISGGFGGLGRALAQRLAKTHQARIVLLGRPRPDEDRSPAIERSRQVFVQLLEELGSEVHRVEVDVLNSGELSNALDIVRQRFGGIDGIFHTAGRLDDALISVKDNQAAMNVLIPKVQGTLALEQAMKNFDPDFQVYFSSVSALAGLPGQIDYSAANSFIDSFALDRDRRESCKHISIGWGSWANSGMASRTNLEARLPRSHRDSLETIPHSVFSLIRSRNDGIDFFAEVSSTKLWYLNEHRLRSGQALLPGTAYVELIASAFAAWQGPGPVEIENLVFAVPLQLEDSESRVLHLELVADNDGAFDVVMSSWSARGDEPLEHISGKIFAISDVEPPEPMQARSSATVSEKLPDTISNPLLDFGKRWHCLEQKTVSNDKAVIDLRLTEDLRRDLSGSPNHPAMMDMAIGGAPELFMKPGDETAGIVPFMIRSIRIWGPLQERVTSHVTRITPLDDSSPESNILVQSVDGTVLTEIQGFCMRKLSISKLDATPANKPLNPHTIDTASVESILADEGYEVISRLLSTDSPAHVVIVPRELNELLQNLRQEFSQEEKAAPDAGDSTVLLPRPALSSDYEAAGSQHEKIITNMWQDALGVADIGIDDNFFELGGHSLLLTKIVSKLRREHQWHLPLEKVFDQLTIREWAKMAEEPTGARVSTIARISRADRSALRASSTMIDRLK